MRSGRRKPPGFFAGASMWQDVLTAAALVLVLEGVLPFLSPLAWRRTMLQVAQLNDTALRLSGLASMVLGIVLLYAVR
jgi:uncharacterized protein